MKYIFQALGIVLLITMALFFYGVYEQYMNAIGQYRAVRLAKIFQKYYKNNNMLPSEFIEEINNTGCLSDERGNVIYIDEISNDSFNIRYAPDEDNVLIIRWNKNMKDIEIESSIKKP